MSITETARILGLRGLLKSAYYSITRTESLSDLLIHNNTVTNISDGAQIDIDSRFIFGFREKYNASHHKMTKSLLHLGDQSVTTASGNARIGPGSVLYNDGSFHLGNSYFNSHARIMCEDEISIGDDCAIAWGVELIDSDFHNYWRGGELQNKTAPIKIEDDVWIGHDVTIKKGVTIGEGAIVASNSLVVDDVPSGTLAVGSPAQVVHKDVRW